MQEGGERRQAGGRRVSRRVTGGRQKEIGQRGGYGFWGIKKLPIAKSYRELSVAGTGFEPAT